MNQAPPRRFPPEGTPSAPPAQPGWGQAPYPDQVYYAARRPGEPHQPSRRGAPGQRTGGQGPRRQAAWLIVSAVSIVLLALIGVYIYQAYSAYPAHRRMMAALAEEGFAKGIYVDNVAIGGMTRAQAEAAINAGQAQSQRDLSITIQLGELGGGAAYTLTQSDIPFARNTAAVLDQAYAIGRQGAAGIIGTAMTPARWRYEWLKQVQSAGAHFSTQITYDKADVSAQVGKLAVMINRSPVDAQVATFDFGARAFTFTQESYGTLLDSEALYNQIVAALDGGQYQAVINASVQSLMPAVTRVELMSTFALVSTYTTETTSNSNRNNNINLACQAVSGTVVSPGETFSFNNSTGQRTTEKGYLPAAAIAGGTTVDEVGGGVCQVSSTLFNAAAMSNLEIVYRSPHTWPSNYVDKGRDATVNWPNLDFKFKNNRETPIFIVAYYQNRKCTVEIYGVTLGAGERIELQTATISTTNPPSEPIYQRNETLSPGTEQELKKARTGYVVETYRVYLRNGVEYKRELLCTSTYKMIQQVIEYN